MGYYNFYRILKEIKYLLRNKKVKKILSIIIISLLILMILHNKGYCAQSDDRSYTPIYLFPIGTTVGLSFDNQTNTLVEYTGQGTRPVFCTGIKGGFTYNMTNYSSDTIYVLLTNDFPSAGAPVMLFLTVASNERLSFINYFGDCYMCCWTSNNSIIGYSDFAISEVENVYARNYVTSADLYQQIHWLNENMNTYNQNILDLINDYLYGDVDSYPISFNNINGLIARLGHFENNNEYTTIYFPIVQNKDYSVSYSVRTQNPSSSQIRYGFTDNVPGVNVNYATFNNWDSVQTSINFTATNNKYFYISYQTTGFSNFNITSNYNPGQQAGIYGGLTDVNNQVITQGEETRDTITNSNIDINSNQLVTDNTQDITENGFDNIFEMIRTAFTGTPSAITFPIPFINQSFTLQPDFLSHYLQVGGLSFFVTLVNAYWYFVVARFIVKKIHHIIETLKEGEFEQTTGNIKTEVF